MYPSQYSRLQQLVAHPYKFLYTGEQIFWKSIRLTFGNRVLNQEGQ